MELEEILELIKNDELDKALNQLFAIPNLNPNYQNKLLLLEGRLRRLTKQYSDAVISPDNFEIQRNMLVALLLDISKDIYEEPQAIEQEINTLGFEELTNYLKNKISKNQFKEALKLFEQWIKFNNYEHQELVDEFYAIASQYNALEGDFAIYGFSKDDFNKSRNNIAKDFLSLLNKVSEAPLKVLYPTIF